MATKEQNFRSGGRNWKSVPDPGGSKNIGLYYEATEAEVNRVKNKTYIDNGNQLSGEPYTATVNGKNYILHSSYVFENGRYVLRPYPPATETANGNAQQFQEIEKNKALKQQLTETQSPNTNPTDPNQPGTPGGSTPTSDPNQPKKQEAQLLTYPSYIKPDQDRIKFQACEIKSRGSSSGTGLQFQFPSPEYRKVGDPVFLAIQAPISDQNSVDWGPDSVNAIDAAIFEKSLSLMTAKDYGKATEELQGSLTGLTNTLKSNQPLIQKFLAGQAASLNNILARTDNIILNPNLELLFQGPQLRPFSFQFKMSARDEDEAKQVRAIIRYFKQNMAVRNEGGLFLKAPYVFTIQYLKGTNTRHKSINTISPGDEEKACALTNCSVDYTPLGSYMTYEDDARTMVAYTLSLQFQELTPVYSSDYDSIPKDEIGY